MPWHLAPKVPYHYEVNGKLVTGNGSLIPICSLSNRSLLPSLTVQGRIGKSSLFESVDRNVLNVDRVLFLSTSESTFTEYTFPDYPILQKKSFLNSMHVPCRRRLPSLAHCHYSCPLTSQPACCIYM